MLRAYSRRDIQHARSMMNSCAKEGLTLAECIGFLDRNIVSPIVKHRCPSCASNDELVEMRRAVTAPREELDAHDIENKDLIIYVCPKCRYSEVVNNDND